MARHGGHQYYVGGVSAAELHGAAHQRAQTYQVVVDRTIRLFQYGDLHVSFFRKQPITDRMWMQKRVPAGYLRVSTPEVTAYDLLFLPKACRSLSRVATVLVELGVAMKAPALAELCELGCETIPLQRLGWLLDRTGWKRKPPRDRPAVRHPPETSPPPVTAGGAPATRDGTDAITPLPGTAPPSTPLRTPLLRLDHSWRPRLRDDGNRLEFT